MSPIISTLAGASTRGYGGLRTFVAASADYELIEKRVLSSNSSLVTFSDIPQTYKTLQFFADLRNTASAVASVNTSVYFNSDTTGSNYQRHFLQNGYAAGLTSGGAANGTFNYVYAAGQSYPSNTATNHMNIYDYTSTSKNKMITNISMFLNNGVGSGAVQGFGGIYDGVWRNTAAVTSVSFEPNDSQIESGSTFWLYGIKG